MPTDAMTRLVTLPAALIEEIVHEHFGIVALGTVRSDGEAASVTRFDTAEGPWAIKVSAVTTEGAEIARWRAGLQLRVHDRGLPAPLQRRSLTGDLVATVDVDGSPYAVEVASWLLDPPVADSPRTPDLLREVGRTAASVAQALADAPEPRIAAGFDGVGHEWELSRTPETLDRAIAQLPDGAVRTLAARARDRFVADVSPALAGLPQAVVHHDLHDDNLLTDGRRITGILDFGDAVRTARVAELVVASAYAARRTAHPADALRQVVAGWLDVQHLTDAETTVLLPAAIGRLAANAAIWAARSHGPRADYARLRAQGSLDAIEALLAEDPDAFASSLRSLR